MSLHQGKAQCSLAVQAWHLLKCGRVEAEWDVTGAEISAAAGAVDDLLRMSSGIVWNEAASISSGGGNSPVNAAGEMLFEQADGAAFVGSLPQNSTPGKYFNYSTGNYQLLQWNLRCACCSPSELELYVGCPFALTCMCKWFMACLRGVAALHGPDSSPPCNWSNKADICYRAILP